LKAGQGLGQCSREHLLHLRRFIVRRRRSKGVLRLRLLVLGRIVVRDNITKLRSALDHIIHNIPAEAPEVDQRSRGRDVKRGYDLAVVGDKTSHDRRLLVCERVCIVDSCSPKMKKKSVRSGFDDGRQCALITTALSAGVDPQPA
jgi:hypothetical protein